MADDLQAGWDAAVAACLTGHETCSFGGMSAATGYWLRDPDCAEKHGDVCAWCQAEAVTGFAGWHGAEVYQVPACQPHADAWAAQHPEWQRRDDEEEAEPKSLDELLADAQAEKERLLADMHPLARDLLLDYERRMDNEFLYADPDGPPPGWRPGRMFTGWFQGIGQTLAAATDTARWRYNQAEKRWEQK